MKLLLIFHLFVLLAWICTAQGSGSKQMKCERITIPLCQKIEYNLTYVPNMFGHPTQTDAALHAHQFWPLVRINCSPDLKLFICATHAPVCEENYGKQLLPCRSFCERVRDACSPVIKTHGMSWPEYLDCNRFPENSRLTVCMEKDFGNVKEKVKRPTSGDKKNRSRLIIKSQPKITKAKTIDKPDRTLKKTRLKDKRNFFEKGRKMNQNRFETCGCMCQKPFVYVNRSIGDGPTDVPSCALQCKEYFFSRSQQNLTTFWITLWSFLCLISTSATCVTALIDTDRFKYPERPVIFISFCFFMVSVGYIIRLARGFEKIACNPATNLLRYSATGPADCTTVFLLTYFFGMAACIWWVILALNWFLSAGMKWSVEAVTSYSQYYHFVSWFIPTVQSMAILAMAGIDSDPVSGLCFVGNHDNAMLTIFVIAPLLVFLTIGSSFLIAGLLALFINRNVLRKKGARSPKMDRMLVKIGIYAVFFLVPVAITILCHFYEHNNRESWEKSKNCPCVRVKDKPKHYVFLVKYLMTLVTGLATGFWVWGTKTVESWRRFINHIFRNEQERQPKAVAL
ncbi:frizzled-8-like [Rhopilema esculentum]|uniref:frizzled-8-like n=1 Tax=Rhopilema esculentum TaxID=499914 RepID=UPI0031E0A02D|eukprot:gene13845-4785_t